eukprot:359081-Chlamydomonas_euryale.AAC.5
MLGYLKTYENIGSARVSCASGCACESATVDGLWDQHYSTTGFVYLNVTANKHCVVEVECLSVRFKVQGVIVNARPYFWDTTATAAHYTFMLTDMFNTMN